MNFSNWKNERVNIYIIVLMGAFTLNLFLSNLGLYGGRTSPTLLVSSIILGMLSILLLATRKSATKFRIKSWSPFILIGVLYLIYGFIFRVPTYILYGAVFLFQMPLFVFSIDKDILNTILSWFSKWFILFYSLYILACILTSPLEKGQYCGVLGNPNLWGECLSTATVVILYSIEKTKNNKFKWYLIALFGITMANVVFSRSRTTILAVIAIFIIYIVYLVKKKDTLKKTIIYLLIAVAVMIPATYWILSTITPYVTNDIGMDVDYSELPDGLSESINATYDRYLKGINDEGTISSGRTEIWAKYISKLSLLGHDAADIKIDDYSTSDFFTNAHNTFLQIGYQSGVPAMIAFTIQFILMGMFVAKKLFQKSVTPENCLILATFAEAFIYMMLSNSFGPYASFSMVMYWLIVLSTYMIRDAESCKFESVFMRGNYFR